MDEVELELILNTRNPAFPPLIARLVWPGPTIVRLFVRISWPLVSVIVPVTLEKPMVPSPAAFASAMAWRSEPGPESELVVTTKVAARAGRAKHRMNSASTPFHDH